MKRERTAWMVSLILLAILAMQLPGSIVQRDDDYAWVRTLVEVHRQVATNYVEAVDDAKLKEKSISGMLSDLDPFTVYVPPENQESFDRMLGGSFTGVGITLDARDGKITVVTPIEGSPAYRAGVMAGDVITKVNGEPLAGLALPEVVKKVSGPSGSSVTLTVERNGQSIDLTMKRDEVVVPTVKGYERKPDDSWNYWACLDPKIAYVRITQFTPDTYDELHRVLAGDASGPSPTQGLIDQGLKGLILDLRFNPGGRLDQAIKVVDLFVKQGSVIVSTKGRNRPEDVVKATGENTLPLFPIVVLVNEHSASAAEIVSGSLKDNNRALVIGERTYGKGSVQEVIGLNGDAGELKMTVAYYYLPSGRLVHRRKGATDWGVIPQIMVPMGEEAERQVLDAYDRQETVRRPLPKATTQGNAAQAATNPASQPVDVQLQQGLNTLIGEVVLSQTRSPDAAAATPPPPPPEAPRPAPTTAPATTTGIAPTTVK